jgi:hypothetical protein
MPAKHLISVTSKFAMHQNNIKVAGSQNGLAIELKRI